MKICTNCKKEKELSEFNKKRNGLQSICRECSKEKLKLDYKNRKIIYLEKARKNSKRYADDFSNYKETLFCFDCGISFKNKSWLCDFHHLEKEDKDFTIARKKSYMTLTTLKKELDKCIPLCANCHRTRHYQTNSDVV